MAPDVAATRRANLRKLVGEYEGMNNLARKLGLTKGAYISQLLTDPPLRTISEKTARKWEKQLELSAGWLDGQPKGKTSAAAPAIDADLLERVLTAVLEELKKAGVTLVPARLSELVTMQYTDSVASGVADQARIRKIVGLFKR